ncbi:MAG: hypothetical protein RL417_1566 [Pseudomonadota bacterium]|jgi:hypothetical protein
MNSPLDLLAFFDSAAPLYPGGVPRNAVAATTSGSTADSSVHHHGSPDAALLFAGFAADERSLLHGETGELLAAAISKGLKLEPQSVGFAAFGPEASAEGFRRASAAFSPRVGVALGARAAQVVGIAPVRGEWVEHQGCWWRVTVEPELVLKDAGQKRVFWNDLQEVSKKLGAPGGQTR